MKMEMSYLLLAFATVLAPLAQGQSTPPQPKITGVLTILSPEIGRASCRERVCLLV